MRFPICVKVFLKVVAFAGVLFALAAPTDFALAKIKELQVALKPDRNPDAMLRSREVLAQHLKKSSGLNTKVIVPSSAAIIQQSLLNGTLDVAFVSSTDFLLSQQSGAAVPLLAAQVRGKTQYESIWLVRKEASFQKVSDLKGKPIGFASRTSTSGYLVPWAHLIKQGFLKEGEAPEKFFGRRSVTFGTGYMSMVERLLQKQVEAVAVSDYVFDLDQHLNDEQKSRLRVLARQGPVPTHILVGRTGLSQQDRKKIQQAFMSLSADLSSELFSGPLIEVDWGQHLSPLEEVLKLTQSIKVTPREKESSN